MSTHPERLDTWLVDGVRDYAIFMLDRHGHVLTWNSGAEHIKGYRAEEIIGQHVSRFYPPEAVERDDPERDLEAAAAEGRSEDEGWRVRKDGSCFWADVVITAVRDAEGRLRGFSVVIRDMSERVETERALRESEERFRLLVESVEDYAILMLDPEGRVVSWNSGAEHIKGYRAEEIIGQHVSRFYAPEDVEAGKPDRDLEVAADVGRCEDEGWRVRKDGSRFYANVVTTALRDDDRSLRGFSQVTRDVTERNELMEKLQHQALHDALTGLPNRVLFLERLRQALARLDRHPSVAAVLFMDIDRFKVVNDKLTHEVGDQVLVALARRLTQIMRPEDTLARFGGDEFAILCEDLADEHQAVAIAKRILRALEEPLVLKERELVVWSSIGVAMATTARARAEHLISDADEAMYRAKESGGGRFEVFGDGMRVRAKRRLENEVALRQAMERDEFRLFLQPVVDLDGGGVIGYEALLRWDHPERGLLLPAEFIPLAEETGVIVPLGRWVLEESCHQAARLQSENAEQAPTMSVNISFCQVAQPELPKLVANALQASGIDPSSLCLELTESVLMEDSDRAAATLRKLKSLGVQLALDDFGTGYSSLKYLQHFPVDTVKIDRGFVAGLGTDADEAAIVAAVLRIGEVLDLNVVAEGVETAAQHDELRALGCHLAQGYYFSPPRPAQALTA